MGIWIWDRPQLAMNVDQIHTPVLLQRCVELLRPVLDQDGAVLIDATVGMGGHSLSLLKAFPRIRLIGLDRDQDALQISRERLAEFANRVTLVHTVYDGLSAAAQDAGGRVDAIFFDLGVSSLQLDRAERGFAYAQDAPLDMRMDQSVGRTAAELIATMSVGQLHRIFERYGEEDLAARYARAIVTARDAAPITRSGQLVEVLTAATPAARRRAGHPAKRVFQALRIEVNQELAALEAAIPAALELLPVGGRIVVLSYQSLEDRLVKRALARASASTAPAGLPVELPEHTPRFRLLVAGAERADDDEIRANPRATPVRLRAAERVREAA